MTVAAGAGGAQAPVAKVVVIGLDGLMYSKIEQARGTNLLRLSGAGLLSRSSIAPHITISGPSWASVLTGVWDRKHGITNNQFTAAPFAAYPTVFTQLERAVDITPTVLDIFDVARPADLDGRSLRPDPAPTRSPSPEPEAAIR